MSSNPLIERDEATLDRDKLQLQKLGYKPSLHRTWGLLESFGSSFCALNFIGGIRAAFFLGIIAGGPAAVWSSYVITMIFTAITAAVLAEICSALPLSSSTYIWAAQSAGPKYGRFIGIVVAWWVCTSWMTFAANNSQATADYVVSLFIIYGVDFPGGINNDNVKWRVVLWLLSEAVFILGIALNYLPPKWYSRLFKFNIALLMVDFVICMIWVPIGVSQTYGFRSAKDVFTSTYNGTGAPPTWNWMLSFLFTTFTITGFDAPGHIAEETKNASVVAAKGIFTSTIATGIGGFITTLMFLFCVPEFGTLFSLSAPQPFVQIYALALGKGGAVFMSTLAILGLIMNTSMIVLAASRLVFAVARDGVLPGSKWLSQVASDGQPRNAVTLMFVFGVALLCMILPSKVAFTALVSGGGALNIATYGLIAIMRLTMTPNSFKSARFSLGKYRKPLYIATAVWNTFAFAVMASPLLFPVSVATFNFASVIMVSVTIFAVATWWFLPEDKWLRNDHIRQMKKAADEPAAS